MKKIVIILSLLAVAGCVKIIKSDPVRIISDLVLYEKAKECRSEKLDLIVYARRPVINPEEDIWTKDIRLDITLRRNNETVTIYRYHNAEKNPSTGKPMHRTFYDFPDMQLLVDEGLNLKKSRPSPEELRKILEEILAEKPIYYDPLDPNYIYRLGKELQEEYTKVVERCLYGYVY